VGLTYANRSIIRLSQKIRDNGVNRGRKQGIASMPSRPPRDSMNAARFTFDRVAVHEDDTLAVC